MSSEVVETADDQHSFEAALAAMNAAMEQPAPVEPEKAPEAAPAPAPTPAPVAPVEAAPAPPSAKELERIAALEAREAKLREQEAAAANKAKNESAQWDAFVRDPVGYVRRMRPDLSAPDAARIAESFYFDALGDKAPPEYRAKQEVAKSTTEVRTEVEQLRTELQELREARAREAQEAELSRYRSELRTGVEAVADAPLVKSLAARNPGRAEELLLEVARRAAIESKERGAAEPVILTAAEAATRLEAFLKAQRDELYGPAPVEAPAQNAAKSSPSTTISNQDASVQPARTAPDLLDDFELRKAALKAAGLDPDIAWRD